MSKTLHITLPDALFEQMQVLAEHLNLSQDAFIEQAISAFISAQQPDTIQPTESERVIHQGDIYWLTLENSSSGIPHPHVVIQHDILNHSRVSTVVVCSLTTNLRRTNYPGNILLDLDEANLPKQSIVEVSKVSTVAKTQLGEYIGTLSGQRITQIFAGMKFLQQSFYPR